jgi:hypothetical protein
MESTLREKIESALSTIGFVLQMAAIMAAGIAALGMLLTHAH